MGAQFYPFDEEGGGRKNVSVQNIIIMRYQWLFESEEGGGGYSLR